MYSPLSLMRNAIFLAFSVSLVQPAWSTTMEPSKLRKLPYADASIKIAVNLALDQEPGVSAHLIDVESRDGIAILSGSVDNLLAKERATEVAGTVRGVRAVVNQIAVTPVAQSDEEIEKNVIASLARDPAADAFDVFVAAENGTVTLAGTVQSWAEKQLAAQAAKQVKGVKDLKNNINIDYKTSRAAAEIQQDIEQRLKWSPWMEDQFITVKVKDGKVTLTGSVGTPSAKARLLRLAHVSGVHEVDSDQIEIRQAVDQMRRKKEKVAKSDEAIKEAVKDAFLFDPRVQSFRPTIQVEDGVVTLTGQVGDLMAKRAAERDALDTRGVERVRNFLKVRPAERPDDLTLTQHVTEALFWNPLVDRYDITVFTINGKVHLSGTVDSRFAKDVAEEVAGSVKGVIEVDNNLVVAEPVRVIADNALEENIEDSLFWNATLIDEDIDVSVDDGVATLRGTVDSWTEYYTAEGEAYDAGAVLVRNRLDVNI